MKINRKDLASIIAEEATNAMLDEGFFDSIRNQINKLKAPPRDIEREEPTKANKAEEKIDDKKVIQNAGIIMANHGGDLKNSKAFKDTPLFKKYIASEEKNLQEQTPFEKEFIGSLQKAVKQGQITAREIYDSIRSVYKSENSLRSAIKGASADADETFGLSTIDRAETVGPGTKPEDAPLAADGDFEDFVSSTEKTQADSEEGEKTQADSEEEVTDDQVEFEAPAKFKTAEELPADSGGIRGSTAPKPDEAPSSASQDSEESTAAARPSAKADDTEMDKTMPSKTAVDSPDEEEDTKVDNGKSFSSGLERIAVGPLPPGVSFDDLMKDNYPKMSQEQVKQFLKNNEDLLDGIENNLKTREGLLQTIINKNTEPKRRMQFVKELFDSIREDENSAGYENLVAYIKNPTRDPMESEDFRKFVDAQIKQRNFDKTAKATEKRKLEEKQKKRLLKLAGILKD